MKDIIFVLNHHSCSYHPADNSCTIYSFTMASSSSFNSTMVTFSSYKSPAEVLVDFWLATKTLGMGFLHSHFKPSVADAEEELKLQQNYIDYFK